MTWASGISALRVFRFLQSSVSPRTKSVVARWRGSAINGARGENLHEFRIKNGSRDLGLDAEPGPGRARSRPEKLVKGPGRDKSKERRRKAAGRAAVAYDPANLRLSSIQTSGSSGQSYTYFWDRVGNLKQRNKPGAQEDFSYDALNRLELATLTVGGATTTTMDLSYDPNGNITSKLAGGTGSDVGTYSYGTTGGGPHAVSNILGARGGTFHYDAAGNLDCSAWNAAASQCTSGSTTLWSAFNLPKRIEYSSTTTYADFSYGPNRERVRTSEHQGSATRIIYAVGPHFEMEASYGGAYTGIHFRTLVYFGDRLVYVRVDDDATGVPQEGYVHQDHLGSIDRISSIAGSIPGSLVTSLSFDAFGKRRDTTWENDDTDARFGDNHWLDWGYTGHQHLDDVRLIHMNGRVQSPIWGRMLSSDQAFGELQLPQSLNGYTYVMNNPLSFKDPTGFEAACADSCLERVREEVESLQNGANCFWCTVYSFTPTADLTIIRWYDGEGRYLDSQIRVDAIHLNDHNSGWGNSVSIAWASDEPADTYRAPKVPVVRKTPQPQTQLPEQQQPKSDALRLQQCIADRYGSFGEWMGNLSYLSWAGVGGAVVEEAVSDALETAGTRQANRLLNSPEYYAGKRTMNYVTALRVVGRVTGVASAFGTGFHAGMLAQCNFLE